MVRIIPRALECHETPEGVTIPLYRDTDLKGNVDAVRMAYVTTVGYGQSKGPIVHTRRNSRVMSLDGHLVNIEYIDADTGELVVQKMWDEDLRPLIFDIPPGVPVLYRNVGDRFGPEYGDQAYGVPGTIIVLADYCWRPNDDESVKYDGWEDYHVRK